MRKLAIAISAVATLATTTPAAAADILLDEWYTFGFAGGVGTSLISGAGYPLGINPTSVAAPGSPWTFTLAAPGELVILDGYLVGDQFSIANFGTTIGTTSTPNAAPSCGNNITACLANAGISKGTFALAAGSHSITGTVIANAPGFSGGSGFFRVNSETAAVPEPATWAMMIFGFAGVGYAMRRRQSAKVRYTFA